MYDWNGNGNRNDMTDNFIEYQIYNLDSRKRDEDTTSLIAAIP